MQQTHTHNGSRGAKGGEASEERLGGTGLPPAIALHSFSGEKQGMWVDQIRGSRPPPPATHP